MGAERKKRARRGDGLLRAYNRRQWALRKRLLQALMKTKGRTA